MAAKLVRIATAFALVAATAGVAAAHVIPVPQSVCAFDPLTLDVPATGLTGAAQPAGTADAVRIIYDSGASRIQICPALSDPNLCGPVTPRPFTLGPTAGTLAFPALFAGSMLASGDIEIDAVPVTFTIGSVAATVAVTFTTGLATLDGQLLEGTPLQGIDSFTLRGVASGDALPPPLTGQTVLLTMSCQPRPVPDKDQFALAASIASIGGQIVQSEARLRATVLLFSSSPLDFAGRPAKLAVHVDGQTVATAIVSGGLQGTRRLSGTSDDGGTTLGVRSNGTNRFTMTARIGNVVLPPQTPGAPVLVDVTLDVAGRLGRGEQLFHVARNGRKLSAR